MRRLIAGMAAALLAAVSLFPVKVSAISAKSYILLDGTTGRVLQQYNGQDKSLIASTTKIMTALVICEQCNVLDRVRIPAQAVGVEGSSMYLKENEVLTVQELLYGLMLHSGNDAAVALAIYCGGTVEGFAQLMNDKARSLGLYNTHFVNPNGLDAPGHYSTAEDMAKLAAYAMENPVFAQTVSTKSVKTADRYLTNHNKLLWQVDGADGVKTGYTKAAGRILVSSACRDGRRLICVTMNDPNDWVDHKALLESGFRDYSVRRIVSAGQCLGTVSVAGGQQGTVNLLAGEDFSFSLTRDESVQIVLPPMGFVYAPVVAGKSAGYASVCVDGNVVAKVPLVYAATVEMENTRNQPFWKSFWKGSAA